MSAITSGSDRRKTVSSKLTTEMRQRIHEEMVLDRRPSYSNMVEVLIAEALAAREAQRKAQ